VESRNGRAVVIGSGVAVVGAVVGTVVADALDGGGLSPAWRWALGGGAGVVLGSLTAAWISRRFWPAAVAALAGAVAFVAVVVGAYDSHLPDLGDRLVGAVVVLALPAFLVAIALAWIAAQLLRLASRGRVTRA
jgi:hypothetical protein